MLVEKELNWLATHNVKHVCDVKKFDNALTNDVFLITDQTNQRYIFKRLNRKARSDEDRQAEFLVQQLAAQHEITPKVLAHSADYKLQQYVQGQLIAAQRNDLSALLATQFMRIHQLPALHAPTQRLGFELQQLKTQLPVSIDEVHFGKMLELANMLDSSSPRDTLCHGDLSLNNILQGDDQQLYILDWEYGVIAGVAYDLAFCNCINEFSVAQSDALIAHYYALNGEPKRQSLQSLQQECEQYSILFNYINVLWGLCFLDNE